MAAETTAVVQFRGNAVTGPLDDKLRTFEQVAANISNLQLNGWKTMQMAKAACWLADAAGLHPAIFMQNHYCMEMQGRLIVEPKWEFVVAVLQSRLPGFKFEVLREDRDGAKVRMSDATGNSHTVEYTLEHARSQGLLARQNAWKDNPQEMCFKQAVKRCAKRIGAAAIMDMPMGATEVDEVDYEVAESNGQPPSPTAAIDAAIDRATKPQAEDVPFEEVPAEAEPESPTTHAGVPAPAKPEATKQSPRQRLYATLVRWYGGALNKDLVAEKASFIYNEMIKERTGTDPKVLFKPGEIGPDEAEQLVQYIEARIAAKQTGAKHAPPVVDDAPPAEEPKPAPERTPQQRTALDAYEELHLTIGRARNLFGRKYLVENPPQSGKFWFTDVATLSQAGETAVLKISEAGQVTVPIDKLEQLNRILAAACDEKERGGR